MVLKNFAKKCHSDLTVYANIVCGAVLAVVIILVADGVHVPTIGVICAMFFALTIFADVTFLESGLDVKGDVLH